VFSEAGQQYIIADREWENLKIVTSPTMGLHPVASGLRAIFFLHKFEYAM
jgi:hypothetical protein